MIATATRDAILSVLILATSVSADSPPTAAATADGYRGLWYFNQRIGGEFVYKYSGGLGTYCAKHKPMAVYRPQVNKTFFCYGGVDADYIERFSAELDKGNLDGESPDGAIYHMVSYFDHTTGEVVRPTILCDKHTLDAHDNPVMTIDTEGYLWIYSTAHGRSRPAFVHKSKEPYDVRHFERVTPVDMASDRATPITNFSYMQAWHSDRQGFCFFYTKYDSFAKRKTLFAHSIDGLKWNTQHVADIEAGHYQISAVDDTKAATAFNYHPHEFAGHAGQKGLNWRTNLYYVETLDQGNTWQAADGTAVTLPLTDRDNAGLVHDYEQEELLVYMKDIALDGDGNPHILFITSKGYASGPANGPRTWRLARWTGDQWQIHDVTTSDNNYDMGSLYLHDDQSLTVIAPTEPGPQPFNPGGEIAMWKSRDGGVSWQSTQLTGGSPYNHTYVRRPVDAAPEFYGFWADGHGRKPSPSQLYFCDSAGNVFRLPKHMHSDSQAPEQVKFEQN
ncbi:BNR-4 repeat-containing protein [Allorhodopirellula heiligendammensis]|uniref:BNR/Asp-box repeat protein n=1 Tax=Allorhodopirellula heiligendammensis TaxID=2714739 RepID=A0A5C6BGL2_9BACT|nr:BNR-4 repeat-containing protein [Allorhodopirellula heiligendammensis]TWU10409.1 hypothetical protein Poly21_43130 [Allorhodopirellula heiligendammensis]